MESKQVPLIDYFERQTTQRNDYRWPKDVQRELATQSIKYKEKPQFKNSSLIKYIDVETLVPYVSGVNIPFTLQWHRKPILQTNPRDHFDLKLIQKSPKMDENIRFTRPRVYKAPEISLDDIPEKEIRDMIIDYTYKSTWVNDSHDAAKNITHRNVPSTTWQSPFDDVGFKEEIISSPVEEEWGRKCGKDWNKLQTCFTIDPDRKFWQENKREKSQVVEELELFDHIIKLEREDKLRMPYKIPKLGYTGFKPSAPFNIEPERKECKAHKLATESD